MKQRTRTKQFIINFGAQLVSFAVAFVINFFVTPYIIKTIGSEAYGFVGLANNFISYASIVTTALNSMFGRFVTISIHQGDNEKANKYFSSVFFTNVIVSVPLSVISAFILIFLEKLIHISESIVFDVKLLWLFLFINFIIGLIFSVFSVATFARNRLDLASLRGIESSVIRIGIIIGFFAFLKPSVWFIGFATLISGIYTYLLNVYYTKKLLPDIKIRKKDFNINMVKELISSGMWNSVSHLSGILSNGLDLLITNLFVTSAAMGVVSVSKTIPGLILNAFGTVSGLFAPDLTKSYALNDFEDMKKQLISAIKLLSFFVSIPLSFMYVFGKEFYSLWVPTQDAKTLYLLTVLTMLAAPFGWALEPLWNIFTVTNKVKQSSLFLLSNALLSTLLVFVFLHFTNDETVKMCIVVGTSTVISIIRNITFLPIFGAKYIGMRKRTFYPVIIKNVVVIIVITLVSFVVKMFIVPKTWLMLIVCGVIISIIAIVISYCLILGSNERIIIKTKIREIVSK